MEAEGSGLGLTPLVDVVFLLLIFFVVATSFAEPRLAIELPAASGAESTSDDELLRVTLTREGGLEVAGEATPWEELHAAVALHAGDASGLELRADEAVPHGRVVEVLDVARAHALMEVEIAVSQP